MLAAPRNQSTKLPPKVNMLGRYNAATCLPHVQHSTQHSIIDISSPNTITTTASHPKTCTCFSPPTEGLAAFTILHHDWVSTPASASGSASVLPTDSSSSLPRAAAPAPVSLHISGPVSDSGPDPGFGSVPLPRPGFVCRRDIQRLEAPSRSPFLYPVSSPRRRSNLCPLFLALILHHG